MTKHSLNVKYYNPSDNTFIGKPNSFISDPLDGIKIENYFSGKTVVIQDDNKYDIKLDINIEIFSERVVLKELIFEVEDKNSYNYIISNKNFFRDQILTWDVDGKNIDSSIWGFLNEFYMNKLISTCPKE